MNLKAISSLVAVVDHGSFSKAALHLDCSKAFLSQQVKALEKQYESQLLIRTTRKLKLTPAGEAFVSECKDAFAHIEQAQTRLLDDQQAMRGKLRIASVGGIYGELFVTPVILDFMSQYPDIEVELDFSSQNVDILNGAYDVAIRFGDLPDSTLVGQELQRYQPLLVASPNYFEHRDYPRQPKDLDDHRLITGTVKQWRFQNAQERLLYHPKSHFNCGNGYAMRQAALNGLGIAHLPNLYVQDHVDSGELIVLMPNWLEGTSPCNILYPPSRFRLKRLQVLVSFLKASLGNASK
jgi:DNA-binding transcriptional LysR family regulator